MRCFSSDAADALSIAVSGPVALVLCNSTSLACFVFLQVVVGSVFFFKKKEEREKTKKENTNF
jgi:hypothetical protein